VTGDAANDGAQPTAAQLQVAAHRGGPLIVLGPAGSGRSEALALRLAALVHDGESPERILLLTRSRAARAHLRDRVDSLLSPAHAELQIATYEEVAERLLRDYATEAGLDPFFATVSAPDRLAILLDRVDELPLRRHEIRGNPAGLLARLLRRIDVLKSEAVSAARLRDWAAEREAEATDAAQRERARRELEFAELYARHDRILQDAGSLDAGDLVLELARLLRDRADVAHSVSERLASVMADEFEDAGVAHQRLLESLAPGGALVCACDPNQAVHRFRRAGAAALESFRAAHPDAAEIELSSSWRFGDSIATAAAAMLDPLVPERDSEAGAAQPNDEPGVVRFWRARGERAQAQAVAREVEQLLAAGEVRPESVCVLAAGG
jgi:DNA helicase II / ATP-dependent DNA helicase PcrA